MKKTLLAAVALFAATLGFAQKPPIDHSVYDSWNRLSGVSAPQNGKWIVYNVNPEEGDGACFFYEVSGGRKIEVLRGVNAKLTEALDYAVVTVRPQFAKTRQGKIDKLKEDKMPHDTLKIIALAGGTDTAFANVKSSRTLGEPFSEYVYFTTYRPDSVRSAGYLLDLRKMKVDTLADASALALSDDGRYAAVVRKPYKKDSLSANSLTLMDLKGGTSKILAKCGKDTSFSDISFASAKDAGAGKLLFYNRAVTDTVTKKDFTSIYCYDAVAGSQRLVVDDAAPELAGKLRIASGASMKSYAARSDARYIDFNVKIIYPDADTTVPDFEKPRLDIWSWDADYNQPVQKIWLADEKDRKFSWRMPFDGGRPFALEDDLIQRMYSYRTDVTGVAYVVSDKPYRLESQWDENPHSDIYAVNLGDGSREKVFTDLGTTRLQPSPDGKYYSYFDYRAAQWFVLDAGSRDTVCVTRGIGYAFDDEENDKPMLASPYDGSVWLDDSRRLLVRDRYDWWIVAADGSAAPVCLTEGAGRAASTQLEMARPYWEKSSFAEDNFFNFKRPLYFTGLNKVTKERSVWTKDMTVRKPAMKKLVEGGWAYSAPTLSFASQKGRKPLPDSKPVIFYTAQNFEHCPDLYVTKDLFKSSVKLTDVNPQQRDYNWGRAELVHWKAADGTPADGILVKPEDFDPAKKYPVIIYFYELYSDELYNYRMPAPSRSTVNWPYFASNGYLVFVPDIRYKVGHPGQSALDYIMPGCDMLCENSWVDGSKMAIQGQSWGGYQVAYMITKTDRFAAAGAGAPVSNMTSAYGGIRLESGMVREMQYECSQSRIGKDLWDGFDLYVENSPLFGVPNVTTPVLIMHNDKDGAVPWQQGVEFFTALRRRGKRAWLLQYNDEEHNLVERRNCKDLSIRLSQFFGHYLKGDPAPKWMTEGIPYTMKGLDYGYETAE